MKYLLAVTLVFLSLSHGQTAQAQVTEHQGQTASGAWYTIAVPQGWQPVDGLVIWNHGFQGYTQASPEPNPSLGPLEDVVLEQGFALAASSFSQTGWAVFNSHIDNQELYETFVELVATPGKLFIQGASMGGIVSVRDLEAGLLPPVDGALLMCGAVGGAQNWYSALDLRLVYEAVCEDVDSAELPTDSWTEIPDPITGELQFLDSLLRCTGIGTEDLLGGLLQTPAQQERLARILDVTGTEHDFLLLALGYAVFELPRLVQSPDTLAGAIPFGNAGVNYGDEDINARVQRTIALPSARDALLANYTPSGAVGQTPIVSIHTSRDGLVRVENQHTLAALIPQTQLTTAVVVEEEPSHCAFTTGEGLAAWNQLLLWSDGGSQPDVAALQTACLEAATDAADCRYDPAFEIGSQLLPFPRQDAAVVSGESTFDPATGQVSIDAAQIIGESALYHLELLPPDTGSDLFRLDALQIMGQADSWQHRPLYSPTQSLLYLPGLKQLPYAAGDTRYDVYLQYGSDASGEGLILREYEPSP